jgi:hypothetical protein
VDALEQAGGLFASDADLDGQRGDPQVKFTPRRFVGPDCKGRRLSQCPPEFLDSYAEALQYSSENPKPDRAQYAKYDKADAARCRSWARRLRSGWRPPPSNAPDFPGDSAADAPGFEAPSFDAPAFDEDDKIPF